MVSCTLILLYIYFVLSDHANSIILRIFVYHEYLVIVARNYSLNDDFVISVSVSTYCLFVSVLTISPKRNRHKIIQNNTAPSLMSDVSSKLSPMSM